MVFHCKGSDHHDETFHQRYEAAVSEKLHQFV